jgi:hypothetical protein
LSVAKPITQTDGGYGCPLPFGAKPVNSMGFVTFNPSYTLAGREWVEMGAQIYRIGPESA